MFALPFFGAEFLLGAPAVQLLGSSIEARLGPETGDKPTPYPEKAFRYRQTKGYVPHMPAFHWLLSREKLFPGWR